MQLQGQHSANYVLNGEKNQIEAHVELKQHQGLGKPGQNLWYGIATLNDKEFEHPDLPNCVNAQFMAVSIVNEEIKKLRAEHGSKLRMKRK